MSERFVGSRGRRERGFALPIVLVFMIVATLTGYFAARLTRSDIKGVNNLQNEKEALTIAEAGIHEALYRLNLAPGNQATVPSVNGGSAFNAAITTQSGSGWNAQVQFTTSGPVSTGTSPNQVLSTPSLQPVASRLVYSNGGAPASETLSVGWDLCTATNTAAGCSASGAIRKLPLSDPRSVVKITSTGVSGAARRKVTVWAVDIGNTGCGGTLPSLISLGGSCTQDKIALSGNSSISTNGCIQVNAGANSSPPSSCTSLSAGGAADITAYAVDLVGSGGSNINPTARTGVLPMTDPLSTLQLPCFSGYTGGARGCQNISPTPTVQNYSSNAGLGGSCTGTAASPKTCSPANNVTLNPGIYYGGLDISGTATFSSGTFIMAGGGFKMGSGGTNVTSAVGGVTIINTLDPTNSTPAAGQYGNFTLGNGNATVTIRSQTSGPYEGIVFVQEPDPSNSSTQLDFNGGTNSHYLFDGIIYAPNSQANLQGNTTWSVAGNLIVKTLTLNGGSDLAITGATTPNPGGAGGVGYTPIAWQDF